MLELIMAFMIGAFLSFVLTLAVFSEPPKVSQIDRKQLVYNAMYGWMLKNDRKTITEKDLYDVAEFDVTDYT